MSQTFVSAEADLNGGVISDDVRASYFTTNINGSLRQCAKTNDASGGDNQTDQLLLGVETERAPSAVFVDRSKPSHSRRRSHSTRLRMLASDVCYR